MIFMWQPFSKSSTVILYFVDITVIWCIVVEKLYYLSLEFIIRKLFFILFLFDQLILILYILSKG